MKRKCRNCDKKIDFICIACLHINNIRPEVVCICEMCGNVHEFVNTGLIKLVKFLENDGKFKTSRTVVEFKGVCSACTE